jgi:hypothetical protein
MFELGIWANRNRIRELGNHASQDSKTHKDAFIGGGKLAECGPNQISKFGRMPFGNMGISKGHNNDIDSYEVMVMIQ